MITNKDVIFCDNSGIQKSLSAELAAKAPTASNDVTLGGISPSVTVPPTQAAVKTFVESYISSIGFAGDDWTTIAKVAARGRGSEFYNIGDEKTIIIGVEAITLQILGFNHDNKADGSGKAGITIGMKNLLTTTYPINASNTNAGGWDVSVMRTQTMVTLFEQLPLDLQMVIKPVKKLTANNGSQTPVSIIESVDRLWLFSDEEVLPANYQYSHIGEGTQYEYWRTRTADADRIKYLNNGAGAANIWWLRSPNSINTTSFCLVSAAGAANYNNASNARGVCAGFSI